VLVVEVWLVLLLTTVLSVDDVLEMPRDASDEVEVLVLREDELLSFEDDVCVLDDDFTLLEELTDFDVDVEAEEDATELDVDAFDEVEMCTDVELEELAVEVPILYKSSLLPAPQYSYGLPGQINEQSVKAAGTEPELMTLPQ
jgi:hypothetical protein